MAVIDRSIEESNSRPSSVIPKFPKQRCIDGIVSLCQANRWHNRKNQEQDAKCRLHDALATSQRAVGTALSTYTFPRSPTVPLKASCSAPRSTSELVTIANVSAPIGD